MSERKRKIDLMGLNGNNKNENNNYTNNNNNSNNNNYFNEDKRKQLKKDDNINPYTLKPFSQKYFQIDQCSM